MKTFAQSLSTTSFVFFLTINSCFGAAQLIKKPNPPFADLALTIECYHHISKLTDQSIFFKAINKGKVHHVKKYLEQHYPIAMQDKLGKTPLHIATARGDIKMTNFLLKNNAPIETQDCEGKTPLFETVKHTETTIALLLLENGANQKQQDMYGSTVLHYAVIAGNEKLVKFLMTLDVDILQQDDQGNSSLDYSVMSNFPEITNLLKIGLATQARAKRLMRDHINSPCFEEIFRPRSPVIPLSFHKHHRQGSLPDTASA
ncbi:ankyrin repeat domain-containing protein [bacterium]|nr:MAG: ankyrin repeat domain-containing protein [bacterium]